MGPVVTTGAWRLLTSDGGSSRDNHEQSTARSREVEGKSSVKQDNSVKSQHVSVGLISISAVVLIEKLKMD